MVEVTIKAIGRRGDGLASLDQKEIYVPFSLPGEIVQLSGSGTRQKPMEIVSESPEREEPICQHFGECGGCQMQHMAQSSYVKWKTGLVESAFTQAGLNLKVNEFLSFDVDGRRRAVFSASRANGSLRFGFNEAESNRINDVKECPILVPKLQSHLEDLKDLASSLPLGQSPARISVLSTSAGLDISIEDVRHLSEAQRQVLVRKCGQFGFARLALGDEVLIEYRTPKLNMGGAEVIPPPGSFVQADLHVEEAMGNIVSNHLQGSKTVADLYCGMGTFALRLAERSKVLAFEENEAALKALDRAWRETGGALKSVTFETRNLDRRPVLAGELKRVDGLVFDPPRAGAELQSKQIARSKVKKVAAVSCNPTTLARDITILIEGGYAITKVIALDQFRFTPHMECIALLEKR